MNTSESKMNITWTGLPVAFLDFGSQTGTAHPHLADVSLSHQTASHTFLTFVSSEEKSFWRDLALPHIKFLVHLFGREMKKGYQSLGTGLIRLLVRILGLKNETIKNFFIFIKLMI